MLSGNMSGWMRFVAVGLAIASVSVPGGNFANAATWQDDKQDAGKQDDQAATDAAERAAAFKAAQTDIARKIKSGVEADRIDALLELRKFPNVNAARMTLGCMNDKNDDVRKAAHETLVSYAADGSVCRQLLAMVKADSRREGWNAASYSELYTLLMSPDEAMHAEVVAMVDAHAAAKPNNLLVLNSVIDGLGAQGDEAALRALRTLGHSELIASDFGFRRGVIQAIISIHQPEAVETLLELFPNIDGEVRGDAIKYLSALSGERYGENTDAWKAWWDKNKEGFEFPNKLETPKDIMAAFTAEGTSTYYDLPVFAKRLVFIIDCSASMRDNNRMVAAKAELIDAINALNEETYFDIVAFNSTVGPWQRTLQKATTPAKAAAAQWVNALEPINYTNSYGALAATFGFKNLEAIYFVSDGAPTVGDIVDKDKIVEAVREGNRVRRVSLYTIGIEPDKDRENSFEGFLRALAEQNNGMYRPVGNFERGRQ